MGVPILIAYESAAEMISTVKDLAVPLPSSLPSPGTLVILERW